MEEATDYQFNMFIVFMPAAKTAGGWEPAGGKRQPTCRKWQVRAKK